MPAGKKTLLITGAGVGLLLVVVAIFWRDLVVTYHVHILSDDPDVMATWMLESEDSVKGRALRRFLRTREGSLALRSRFLARLFRLLEVGHRDFLPGALRENQIIQGGIYELAGGLWLLLDGPSTLVTSVPPTDDLLALRPLFEFVASGDFELADYPGIRFTTWAYREEVEDRPVVVEVRMTRSAGR